MTELTITPGKSFEEQIAAAEAFLTRGLETGENMLTTAQSPAQEARAAGFDIPEGSEAAFDEMFATEIAPKLVAARTAIERGVETWPSLKCSSCVLVCWAVGVAIVGLGTAAAGSLTAGSSVVVSLANLVGCSPGAALAFLKTVIPLIAKGVRVVVGAICIWTQTCTKADLA